MLDLEQRQMLDRQDAQRTQAERQPPTGQAVVITGIAIPFWSLVWWLVGITGGVSLIHALFDWLIGIFMSARLVN